MIALDTNAFVRLLVNTPDGETDQVRRAREVVVSAGFVIADPVALEAALTARDAGKGDFADYLIRVRARALGAATLYTFDGELHGAEGFAEP